MNKLEARIREHGDGFEESLFEVAVAFCDFWLDKGQYKPKEAYSILYHNKNGTGQIVEAIYNGGPTEFIERNKHKVAQIVEIPESIVNAARNPFIEIPLSRRDENLSEEELKQFTLSPWEFKPLSDQDLNYIRDNCFRSD